MTTRKPLYTEPVTVLLSQEQVDQVREKAYAMGISVSSLIRMEVLSSLASKDAKYAQNQEFAGGREP